MRGSSGQQELDSSLGEDEQPASGTEDSEYVACPELTAITADGGTQAPTND